MKTNNIKSAAAVALSLTLFACSASAPSEGDDLPEAPVATAPSAPTAPAPTAPVVKTPAPMGTGTTGGTGGTTGTMTVASIALHCPLTAAQPGVCIENVQGHAGDIVEIPVVLIKGTDNNCFSAREAYARFQFPIASFALANVADQVDCRSRYQIESTQNIALDNEVAWQAFGTGSGVAGCNTDVGSGKVDVIKMQIKPGTPPGDYVFDITSSYSLGVDPLCHVPDAALKGTVRVLP